MIQFNSIKKHFCVITRHHHEVFKNCVKAGIPLQGLLHDLSKYSFSEFWISCLNYQGTRSPTEFEREKNGYSSVWMHHKGRNKHHFEYWMDYDPIDKVAKPVKMPLKYVIEMFCDRVAASKIYGGENYNDGYALQYFLKRKSTRIIHPETSALLERLLIMLSEKGEDYTFKFIRKFLIRSLFTKKYY